MVKKLYYYAQLINQTFWLRVAESTTITESSLGIFRWFFGFFLLFVSSPQFGWIAQVPNAFFAPPYFSLANLFDRLPGNLFFFIIDSLIGISIACITIGIKARIFSAILLCSWLIGNNFAYSLGKISHGNILLLALLLCMIFSNWGVYYALVPDIKLSSISSKKGLAVFAVILAFGMFTAGFKKALNWIDFDFTTSGFLEWFLTGYYGYGRTTFLSPIVLSLPKWIFEFADYAAAVFEMLGFIALLNSRKWWLCWLFSACLFHLANTLLLGLPFTMHVLVYLVFIDFSRFRQKKLIFFKYSILSILIVAHLYLRMHKNSSIITAIARHDDVFLWIFAAMVVFIELLGVKKKVKYLPD